MELAVEAQRESSAVKTDGFHGRLLPLQALLTGPFFTKTNTAPLFSGLPTHMALSRQQQFPPRSRHGSTRIFCLPKSPDQRAHRHHRERPGLGLTIHPWMPTRRTQIQAPMHSPRQQKPSGLALRQPFRQTESPPELAAGLIQQLRHVTARRCMALILTEKGRLLVWKVLGSLQVPVPQQGLMDLRFDDIKNRSILHGNRRSRPF